MPRKAFFARKQREQRESARRQVEELLARAGRTPGQEAQEKMVRQAYRLALKNRVRLSRELRKKFCRKCLAYWVVGRTVRVRVIRGTVTYSCLRCGARKRFVKQTNQKAFSA